MSRQVTRVKFGFSREAGRKLEPKELLNFIEEPGFLEEFTAFGFTDDDLEVIQYAIMLAPEDGVIVPVSHSIRDLFYQNDHHKAVVRYVYFHHLQELSCYCVHMRVRKSCH